MGGVIKCTPSAITLNPSSDALIITLSINNNPAETLTDEYKILSTFNFAPDGTSYAFMSSASVGIAPNEDIGIVFSGLSIDGVTFDDTLYNPKDGFVSIFTGEPIIATDIVPEVNTVTIMPTVGVEPSDDMYYLFGGDASGTPIVLHSCAKAVIGGDVGDTIPSDFSYIDIVSLPTTSVFGPYSTDVNVNIAACLKIQVGDSAPFISNFVADRMDLAQHQATPEQAAINFLLQKIASGVNGNPWGYMESMKSKPEIIYAGLLAINHGEGVQGTARVALVALNDFYMKLMAFKFVGTYYSEFDAVPFDELKAYIDANPSSAYLHRNIEMIDSPSTLTFSRCTQTEIDNLFEGNHQPHVDMFDSIKSLLPNENSEINSDGLASAIYYPERDVIEFKTKYRVEITEKGD